FVKLAFSLARLRQVNSLRESRVCLNLLATPRFNGARVAKRAFAAHLFVKLAFSLAFRPFLAC
ncbi:MAG: hypothetical protein IJV80_01955, partial [Clostridia bacterium]|nr:hypothetical protein [Clostridia bacterium]